MINPPIPGQRALVTLVFLCRATSSTAFLGTVEAASRDLYQTACSRRDPGLPYHFTAPTRRAGLLTA